jgi:hypothetical protein
LQTVIQVICSNGESLREKIVKDKRLEDYSLLVSKQRSVGRNPGWSKIYSNEYGTPGALNLTWHKESMMLMGRVITKGSSRPDQLISYFVRYLLARHKKRVRMINILME